MLLGLAAFLADLGEDCPTWRVYSILQELCAPRVLVDKTPPNSSHPNILHRSYEIFASPSYVHLVRHPYAAIGSGVQLACMTVTLRRVILPQRASGRGHAL